ncbi:MAG TPA: hypothetical protein GX501_07930 [Clostridiaceae bacterium]|nr:hypothetical protein [Clostridiaceae bacterium]
MKIYPESTYLHGSDRHVLNKYRSEFYDFSPEQVTGRIARGSEKVLNAGRIVDPNPMRNIIRSK